MTHRWRTKMIKRLTGDVREHALAINQRLDRQEELMNAQQRTLEALQRALAAQHSGEGTSKLQHQVQEMELSLARVESEKKQIKAQSDIFRSTLGQGS